MYISQVLSCKNRPPLGDSALQRFIERTWGLPGAGLAQTIPQVRGDRKTAPATKFWCSGLYPRCSCARRLTTTTTENWAVCAGEEGFCPCITSAGEKAPSLCQQSKVSLPPWGGGAYDQTCPNKGRAKSGFHLGMVELIISNLSQQRMSVQKSQSDHKYDRCRPQICSHLRE